MNSYLFKTTIMLVAKAAMKLVLHIRLVSLREPRIAKLSRYNPRAMKVISVMALWEK